MRHQTWIVGLHALAFAALAPALPAGAESFSVMLIPDTQHYVDDATRTLQFEAQTQWIADNQGARNITFSTLVGDIVENGGGGPPVDFMTPASNPVEDENFLQFEIDPGLLVAGDNVLAVEVHQVASSSSDLSFDLDLISTGAGTLVPAGATWLYLDDGSDQGSAWQAPAFIETGWFSGPAELGYGDGGEATLVRCDLNPVCNPASQVKFITTYFRHHFNVVNPATVGTVTLGLKRDDGAMVFLNGTEIFRTDMPGAANSNQTEWDRADLAMSTLDGDLQQNPDGLMPYAAVCGNHDYDIVDDKGSAFQFLNHFGPSRYTGRSWFLGNDPSQINMAQFFQADGKNFLHLGLEWHPSDAAIEWAQSIIVQNPTVPTIISTHEHLLTGLFAFRSTSGQTPDATGDNSGEDVYRKLVVPFPQVFLVLSGHTTGNGRNFPLNPYGLRINEILADFQADPNGGNGWMQAIEFRPDTSEIEYEMVSPTYVPGVTPGPNRALDPDGNFTVTLDINGTVDYLESTAVVQIREGQDNGFGVYSDMRDTHIGDGGAGNVLPNVAYGSATDLHSDGDGDDEQSLLAFDDLIGLAPGQIPPGTTLDVALVTLTTEGNEAASFDGAAFHRMTVPWDESTTWNDLVGGVQLGSEAEASADATSTGGVDQKGTRSFDVTSGVQAWVNGAANHGWVTVNSGTDSWRVRSSDWAGIAERPLLSVAFPAGCDDAIDNDGDGDIDLADPGCTDSSDGWETELGAECDDGRDNDMDGDIDGADPACAATLFTTETTICDDGIDNDGDLLIDWDGGGVGPPDPQCANLIDNSEAPNPGGQCGMGSELVFLLPALTLLRARRRRHAS